MNDQGQGWLRGAIIAGAIAAVGAYIMSRGDGSRAAGGATEAAGGALSALGSSEVGQRGGRILGLLVGNVSDQALGQVKSVLKDAVRQLDALVDEL